ncbi:hypothetical protein H072_7195 [Dactylellina haptotyla CBS 200.50]|uniref:Histidine kinase n=1 Tax=Dactylellina haptotyla (strain CBS 200.50) TaxID=1284197 RepID=S8BUP4_DACHA|nr:hypothetical protein H072_7195 [Dactylellina haptotyla CBS 200.50]
MANDVIPDNPLKRKTTRDPAEMLRSRELYRYYQPPQTTTSSKVISSEDPSLTAYAQLTSLRLRKHRAMISLIDHDTQWIIGESAQTGAHDGSPTREYSADTTLATINGLCVHTVEMQPPRLSRTTSAKSPDATGLPVSEEGNPGLPHDLLPLNEIEDLSLHPKFSAYSFVNGDPSLRYYCGCPLRTRKGYYIGSLCIIDTKPGKLSDPDTKFLRWMADTIMQHLETVAEKRVMHKVQRMQSSLSVFVDTSTFDRKRTLRKAADLKKRKSKRMTESPLNGTASSASKQIVRADSVSDGGSKHLAPHLQNVSVDGKLIKQQRPPLTDRNSSMSSNASSLLSKGSMYSQTSLESDAASTPTITVNPLEAEPQTPESAFKGIFSRACRLIRDALQIDGVAIIDAGDGYLDDTEESQSLRSLSKGAQENIAAEDMTRNGASSYFRQMGVLGFDVQQSQANRKSTSGGLQNGPLGNLFLDELFVSYPAGKIFSYDADGTISSGEEEESNNHSALSPPGSDANSSVDDEIANLRRRPEYVRKNLAAFLPGSTSCIFVPLYESADIPYASCFVWTTQSKRVFVKEEIGYLKTFGRLIMSEVVRLDTLSADRAKGAFISNISHELRSPLHGILASAELLDDTRLDTLQRDFLTAIESCGRTLLDTLNHVLDFSKLNRLQNDRKNMQASPLSDKLDTQVVQDVDLAAVTEEVVEGIYAGFDFRGINSHIVLENASTTDIIPLQPDASVSPNVETSRKASLNRANPKRDIEVIIDIDRIGDWHFRTEVGGFRRVVMNLVGNALKYTDKGYVKVKLEAEPYFEDEAEKTDIGNTKTKVRLTVSDSGRGISREFLKTKLYVPFSQENAMSSGTGLGMSIVRQILDILGGTIDVKSELGVGTEVTVNLILHRSLNLPDSTTSSPKEKEEALDVVSRARAAAAKKTIAFLGFNNSIPAMRLLKSSLAKCSKDWYGMNAVEEDTAVSLMEFIGRVDVLVANETSPLLSQLGVKGQKPPVIILCSNAARVDMSNLTLAEKGGILDFASKPCGPKKLAKALLFCLTRTHSSRRSSHSSSSSGRTGIYRSWSSFSRPIMDREKSFTSAIEDDIPTGAVRISPPVRSGSSSSEPVVYVAGVGPIAPAAGSSAVPMSSSPGRQKSIPFLEDFQAIRLKAQAQTQASMQSISGIMHRDSKSMLAPMSQGSHMQHGIHHLVDGALIGEGVEIDRPPFASPVIEKDNPLRPKSWAQWQSLNASADGDEASPNSSPQIKTAAKKPEDIIEELRILSGMPSILLVDDNPTTMKLMTTYVTKKGFSFSEALNGFQALETFRQRAGGYDIILMDLQLPVMSGLDAVKAIRDIERTESRQKRAFIIALTGSSNESEALIAGCDRFFTKPIKFSELSSVIAEYQQSHLTYLSQH